LYSQVHAYIKQFLIDRSIQLSVRPYLDRAGVGMTRVLAGVGDMLQARSHRRI